MVSRAVTKVVARVVTRVVTKAILTLPPPLFATSIWSDNVFSVIGGLCFAISQPL